MQFYNVDACMPKVGSMVWFITKEPKALDHKDANLLLKTGLVIECNGKSDLWIKQRTIANDVFVYYPLMKSCYAAIPLGCLRGNPVVSWADYRQSFFALGSTFSVPYFPPCDSRGNTVSANKTESVRANPQESGFIKSALRLPEAEGYYAVITSELKAAVAFYNKNKDWAGWNTPYGKVEWWFPLPQNLPM